jgi:hypothetical protein
MSVAIRIVARAVVCVVDGCCAVGAATVGTSAGAPLCPGLRDRIARERLIADFRRELRAI